MIYIDFETYSETDIRDGGVWKYSTHPSTEILCMAFAIDNEPVEIWTPENGCNLDRLFMLLANGSLIEAHNAFFERCIWQNVATRLYNFITLQNNQWRCSAAIVASLSLPRSLENAAKVLECKNQKDKDGGRVMLKLCKPRTPTKNDSSVRYTKESHPELYEALYAYCKQDVEVEREISELTRPLIESEQNIWFLDQEINARGVPIDVEAIKIAYDLGLDYTSKALDRVLQLTNGEVNSFRQVKACAEWCKTQGYPVESFSKEYLLTIQDDKNIPDNVKELITIRQQSAKTSTAKYESMIQSVSDDGRIRDNYMYHGASTGRWSGKNVQFQNLPRGKIKDMDSAIDDLKMKNQTEIESKYGIGIMEFLSYALRGMIVAPDGKQLYVSDYAAIEARGVAWISGQEDLLEDFRSGEKIYEKQAAFTYNKPIEEIDEEGIERFVGKTLVLACGYGMGANKFQMTCAASKVNLELDFCERAVKSYREKNWCIVKQWHAQEKAAILAVKTGKPIVEGKVTWFIYKKFLYCKLPSGRCLAYFMPKIKVGETTWGSKREQLYIMGEKSLQAGKIWCEYSIYGGLIVENIVQAICRDIVAFGMTMIQKAGYDIIMHSHDEIIAEAPIDFGSIQEYEELMCSIPNWATGFPIKSKGWIGKRYKK